MYRRVFKRLFDITFASIGLILTFPIFLFVSFCLLLTNRGSPFFLQMRPGLEGKAFKIIKFKTMTDARDMFGNLLPDSERLTRIGRLIRKTSLDEIPQLINVIMGQMSLIGPRPLLPNYLPLYSKRQLRRHEVRPGITGWAQINGRNAISWEQKFECDIWYVDHLSLLLDLKILYRTVIKVLKSDGISQDGEATMQPFKGNGIRKLDS